ncbi:MAG: hypothetical protein KGL35_08850 [Bradyrhizobium sp.]|nr:hypothetical protein [Bradyrhizobium sp.]
MTPHVRGAASEPELVEPALYLQSPSSQPLYVPPDFSICEPTRRQSRKIDMTRLVSWLGALLGAIALWGLVGFATYLALGALF